MTIPTPNIFQRVILLLAAVGIFWLQCIGIEDEGLNGIDWVVGFLAAATLLMLAFWKLEIAGFRISGPVLSGIKLKSEKLKKLRILEDKTQPLLKAHAFATEEIVKLVDANSLQSRVPDISARTSCGGGIASRQSFATLRSWTFPAVRKITQGRPRPSVTAWVFVFGPPLLRPMAWAKAPLLRHGRSDEP